jgi:hypothetical protein
VEISCELGDEPSGSIKCWESTEWLHNLWPLERYSAPQLELREQRDGLKYWQMNRVQRIRLAIFD